MTGILPPINRVIFCFNEPSILAFRLIPAKISCMMQSPEESEQETSPSKTPPLTPQNAAADNTKTLLEWLLLAHPNTPKVRAKQWIMAGRVKVNGVVQRKPHLRLTNPGEGLDLGSRHAGTLDCGEGWLIHPRVSLLYLDSAVAIVNKGPGLLSVSSSPGEMSAQSILGDFLIGKLRALDRGIAGKTLPPSYRNLRPLPVHRLDQYTSGVFCLATNPKARQHLIDQLKVHSMSREYVAFVEGKSAVPKGTWRNWLELTRDELRQQIRTEAEAKNADPESVKEAITHFEVIDEFRLEGGNRFVTKIRLKLETGRKHQIRVQAANAGMPLIGDRTYNTALRRPDPNVSVIEFPRQALHAETLNLEHPEMPGRRMSWVAELPKDLRQLEAGLRAGRVVTVQGI